MSGFGFEFERARHHRDAFLTAVRSTVAQSGLPMVLVDQMETVMIMLAEARAAGLDETRLSVVLPSGWLEAWDRMHTFPVHVPPGTPATLFGLPIVAGDVEGPMLALRPLVGL